MTTQFVDSAHNFRIAYEVQGSGPALLLVHGFNNDRTMWREHGWIDQLQATFTVITISFGHDALEQSSGLLSNQLICVVRP